LCFRLNFLLTVTPMEPWYPHRKAEGSDWETNLFGILDNFWRFQTAWAKVFINLS
jgi:hypothetical protein